MARKLERREVVLIVVLAIFVLGLLWNNSKGPGSGSSTEKEAEKGFGDISAPVVRLADLEISNIPIGERNRDLFSFGVRPTRQAVIDESALRIAEARRKAREAEAARRKTPAVKPAPRPPRVVQAPKPPFTFIGIVGPKDGKIAVFEEGQTVLIANVGEIIKEPFLLKDVGFESVTIGYTDERFKNKTTELKMPKDRRR